MTKLRVNEKVALFSLVLFVLFEFPVRVLLQPDPWLLHPLHWYFNQPMRVAIEAAIVFILLVTMSRTHCSLLKLSHKDIAILMVSVAGAAALFGALEFDQLKSSFGAPLSNIIIWGLTGFLIGIGQELIYRGFLYTALCSFVSNTSASLITTFCFVFAPLHSLRMWDLYLQGEYKVMLILVVIFFSAGFFFQWLRDKSGNIIVPGITHGVGNAITWLAVFS